MGRAKEGSPLELPRLVAVGSTNPIKVQAVRNIFTALFGPVRVEDLDVPSGVREQPLSHDEMRRGAHNRALAAMVRLGADVGVGIEAGVVLGGGAGSARGWESPDPFLPPYSTGWTVIVDRERRVGAAPSPILPLPPAIAQALAAGEELGPLIDRLSGVSESKKKQGFVGFMTRGALDRLTVTELSIALALVPFLHPELYRGAGQERFGLGGAEHREQH